MASPADRATLNVLMHPLSNCHVTRSSPPSARESLKVMPHWMCSGPNESQHGPKDPIWRQTVSSLLLYSTLAGDWSSSARQPAGSSAAVKFSHILKRTLLPPASGGVSNTRPLNCERSSPPHSQRSGSHAGPGQIGSAGPPDDAWRGRRRRRRSSSGGGSSGWGRILVVFIRASRSCEGPRRPRWRRDDGAGRTSLAIRTRARGSHHPHRLHREHASAQEEELQLQLLCSARSSIMR